MEHTAIPGKNFERKTLKGFENEECDASNLKRLVKQHDKVIDTFGFFSRSKFLPGFAVERRMRRNRRTEAIRSLIQETYLHPEQLILPLFVTEEEKVAISSLPGVYRLPISDLLREIEEAQKLGIQAINLFCHVAPEQKDALGSEAYRPGNLFSSAIKRIREHFPDLLLIGDIALDPFTTHGHDGVLDEKGYVDNDRTLEVLGKMALLLAESGVSMISPSDMMDGRVSYLRKVLDAHHFHEVGILSYGVKFSSSLYAPFRNVLDSHPSGDKKSYQVNPRNGREALLECLLDDEEGADMLLVKPAITSLDVISELRKRTLLPIGAYQVSGEYAMIKAAEERGWIDGDAVLMESLLAMRRAGADFIITYGAKDVAQRLC